MNPRIYSDYNGPYQPDFMPLSYRGTKADLDRLGITPSERMKVTVYADSDEEEDLEADGFVSFVVISGTNGNPCCYADARGSEIRYVKRPG